MSNFLDELEALLKQRQTELPEASYSTKLFKEGSDRILRKVGEEAAELIIAGKNNDSEEICNEAADLLFHLLIFLRHQNLSIQDVILVLKERQSKP